MPWDLATTECACSSALCGSKTYRRSIEPTSASNPGGDLSGLFSNPPQRLLNRRRWKTRVELATAISDYIDRFHNTRRRHSALGMLTPTEYEHHWHDPRVSVQSL